MRQHLQPQRPVVLHISPYVEPMGDVFLTQDFTELQVTVEADVPVTGAEYDLHLPQFRVIGIWHEVDGVIEVDVVVVVPVHERLDVERPTEVKQVAYHIGMAESEVTGAEPTEADATAGNLVCSGIIPDLGNKFFGKEPIVLDVAFYPVLGMDVTIPAVVIDAIGTKYLNEAPIYEPANGFDHAPVFSFAITPERSWEYDQRIAFGSESQNFHIVAKVVAVEFG